MPSRSNHAISDSLQPTINAARADSSVVKNVDPVKVVQKTSKDRRFEGESEKREKKTDEMSFGWGLLHSAFCERFKETLFWAEKR
jgi:hypothetical protein